MGTALIFVWVGFGVMTIGILVWAFRQFFGDRRRLAKWGGLAAAVVGFVCMFALGLTQIR